MRNLNDLRLSCRDVETVRLVVISKIIRWVLIIIEAVSCFASGNFVAFL